MTKLHMARRIAQALFNAKEMPNADNWKVQQLCKRKKGDLEYLYAQALALIPAENRT